MSVFFEVLKRKKDLTSEQKTESQSEPSTSFFSSLKRKRDFPKESIEIDESIEHPETISERIRRGAKDVATQTGAGFISGLGGSYGDISSLLGINPPEGYINPGEKATYEREHKILEKMEQSGYKPSVSDIYALSSDDDIIPRYSRLPTSTEINRKIEELGGPGEATTPEGAAARRASQIFGGGASFGSFSPIPAVTAGVAGEATQALGGGPLAQSTAEIIAILASQGRPVNALTSNNPAVKARIDTLRKLGYTDKNIILSLNAQKASSNRVKKAMATSASEKSFAETLAKSESLFEKILEESFPNISKGVEYLHEAASDIYGNVAREAKGLKIQDSSRFKKVIDNTTQRLRNTLGENPDAKQFIKRLEEASVSATHQPSADTYINFYKELNKIGNWVNPKEKEALINHVKNGIKSTFRNSGYQGRELAEKFEKANKGIQKAYQAQSVNDLFAKATTAEGIDWKKMLKLFDKQSTWDILRKSVGDEQAQNLHKIAKVSKDVGDFSKYLGSKVNQNIDKTGTIARNLGFLWSILEHNPKYAILGIGAKATASGSKSIYAHLQTKLLTDPKFQNLTIRSLEAIKSGSPKAILRASQDLEKWAKDEGVDFNPI